MRVQEGPPPHVGGYELSESQSACEVVGPATSRTSLAGSPSQLAPRPSSLATDLDWIVMKCLEKERNRRYETANGLAADLSRHLSNEPVVARPPGAVYRFEKWVRRNKLQFAAVMIIGIVLVAATAVSSWQAVRAARAQRAFKEQAETAQSVKNFLVQQLLGGGGVWERRPFDTNNRVLVERITREVEGKFTNQPLVEAEIRYALGDAFDGMDYFSKALPQYEKAFAVRKVQLGAAHSETLLAASQIGWQLYNLGRHREADGVLDDTIAVARGASQILTHGAAEALFARGWRLYYDGRPEHGMPYIKEALASFKAALGDNHIRVSAGRFLLAACTHGLGRLREADLLFKEGMRDCARITPKVYLNDTGLLARLLGLTVDRLKVDGTLSGGVLENFVLMELRKQAAWSETQPEFFYWRTASGQEVDIVLEDGAGWSGWK